MLLDHHNGDHDTYNYSVWGNYIFLDVEERRRFALEPLEYLIEQVQYLGSKSITANAGSARVKLNFNHPVKELQWVMSTDANLAPNSVTGNNLFNFSSNSKTDPFRDMKLQFNGQDRFVKRDAKYFRTIQPYKHHSGTPRKHIYTYSFSLNPEKHQPSGTCNMSRLDLANMMMTFNSSSVVDSKLKVYALSYNVFRVMSGMGGLAF